MRNGWSAARNVRWHRVTLAARGLEVALNGPRRVGLLRARDPGLRVGREDRSRKRFDVNLLRRVGRMALA